MADDKTGGQTDPNAGGDGQKSDEESFWEKLDKKLDDAIDRNVKKHLGQRQPGNSRTGAPTPTIPRFLATMMGGPFAPKDNDKS